LNGFDTTGASVLANHTRRALVHGALNEESLNGPRYSLANTYDALSAAWFAVNAR
jgi:hypothetical protein